jgi:hypothetical protein
VEVLQAWRQGTLRAAGAAALAPTAIVAAAAVIALAGGGLGGLGSLGQLVSGPALHDSSPRSGSGGGADARSTAVRVPLLAALPGPPGRGGGAGGGVAGGGGGGTGGGTGPTSGSGIEGGGPSTGFQGGDAGGGHTPGGGAAPAPPVAPPAPLTQIGDVVRQITAPVPEPVRSTADQVVDAATGAAGRALGTR